MRGLAYRRKQRAKHIKRKENIIKSYRLDNPPHKYDDSDMFGNVHKKDELNFTEGYWHPYWYVESRGSLNKGKIHCSCSICSVKTRNKGRRRQLKGNYDPAINRKPSEARIYQKMNWDEDNWEQEKEDNLADYCFEKQYGWLRNKLSEEKYVKLKNNLKF